MIPFTHSIAAVGGPTVPTVDYIEIGRPFAIPRPLMLTRVYVQAWFPLPAVVVNPHVFIANGAGGRSVVPRSRMFPFIEYYSGAAQDRYRSGRDPFFDVVIPQSNDLRACFEAVIGTNYLYRVSVTISGFLLTETMLNTQELAQWQT